MVSDSFQISYSGARVSPGAEAPFVSELNTLLASESQELEEGIQQEIELLQADKESQCQCQGGNRASLQPCSDLQILNISYFTSIFQGSNSFLASTSPELYREKNSGGRSSNLVDTSKQWNDIF